MAMGYAVDEQWDEIKMMSGDADAEMQWPQPFARLAELVTRGGAVARLAQEQTRLWRALAASLPANGRALMITHGGIVEAGVVGCLPNTDFRAWGDACGYCEGVQLEFDGAGFASAGVLRVKETRISNQ